ncbi:MAG: TRAP transporter small permease [Pseudomonadota bacterium]
MWLKKTADILTVIAKPAAKGLNYLAAAVLAAMMILTGIDVFFRYLFDKPVTGSFEMTEFMMPIIITFGFAFCALEKGHVQVELLTSMLSKRGQAFANCFASLVFLSMFGFITWQSWMRAKGMMSTGQISIVLYAPIYPFVLAVAVGSAALCLVLLRDFFSYLSEATTK